MADAVVLGADGEPLADWEIALLAEGNDGDTTGAASAPATGGSARNDDRNTADSGRNGNQGRNDRDRRP